MKRKITLLKILCLITKLFALEHNQIITTFTPLEEDETVEWEIINNKLEFFKCTKETRKEVSVNSSLNYSTHSPRILKGVISMFQGSSLFQSSAV